MPTEFGGFEVASSLSGDNVCAALPASRNQSSKDGMHVIRMPFPRAHRDRPQAQEFLCVQKGFANSCRMPQARPLFFLDALVKFNPQVLAAPLCHFGGLIDTFEMGSVDEDILWP